MQYSQPLPTLDPLKVADSNEGSHGVVANTWVVAGTHLRWLAGTEGSPTTLTKGDIAENMRRLQQTGSTGHAEDYLDW